jgi:L-threonylcarbamoyladenylate synthase
MSEAIQVFQRGGVIAYPTEAVFGLGCDPDNQYAIEKLLAIKNRPKSKGLILLAGQFEQLLPYIAISELTTKELNTVLARWPNGITQVLPAQKGISSYLTGDFSTIAVRVTTQSDVVSLCQKTNKPIVSTSANLSGLAPAKTWQTLDTQLVDMIDHIIKGDTLAYQQPSKIINGLTGEVFRI